MSYLCAPEWHNGDKTIQANYLVLASPEERRIDLFPNSFACCEAHLTDAIKVVLDKHRNVTVRQVNRPSEQRKDKLQLCG